MRLKATRSREVAADAIARLVAGRSWSGTTAELFAAIGAAATSEEREAPNWPRSAVALGAGLLGLSDALREHGLRLLRMPDAVLVEPVPVMAPGAAPARGRTSRAAA